MPAKEKRRGDNIILYSDSFQQENRWVTNLERSCGSHVVGVGSWQRLVKFLQKTSLLIPSV